MATTYIGNLAHAVRLALEKQLTTGNVYYVVDTELAVSRDFFTELSSALGWSTARSGGPVLVGLDLCADRAIVSASDASDPARADERL